MMNEYIGGVRICCDKCKDTFFSETAKEIHELTHLLELMLSTMEETKEALKDLNVIMKGIEREIPEK